MPEENQNGGAANSNPNAAPAEANKPPESVPWSQYVGTKESLTGKLTKAEQERDSLKTTLQAKEDELKSLGAKLQELSSGTVPKAELEQARAKLAELENQSFEAERKAIGEAYGLDSDKIASLTKEDVAALTKAKSMGVKLQTKTSLDLGGGGGASGLVSVHDKLVAGMSELRK